MPNSQFMTTQWSVVRAAAASSVGQRQHALELLCQRYWIPLYAFLRRSGHSCHDAQDLTQGFFAVMLDRNYLQSAQPDKGRFRTFMLVAVKRFAAKQRDREQTQKRGGQAKTLSMDFAAAEAWYRIEPAERMTAEMLFERRWAISLLETVMVRLRQRFLVQDKAALFDLLKPHLVCDRDKLPYVQIAKQLDCTVSSLKSTMHRLRKWYRELLRAEIAETVAPEDVDDELACLMRSLSENS